MLKRGGKPRCYRERISQRLMSFRLKGIAILGVSCLLTAYCLLPTSTFAADKTAKLKDEAKVLKQEITHLKGVISQLMGTLDKGTRSGKDEKGWFEGGLEPSGTAGLKDVRKGETFYSGGSWEQKIGDTLFPYGGKLLRTGQDTCCAIGDDAWWVDSVGTDSVGLAFDFDTLTCPGTVIDNNTGLMWARDGNGVGCMGGADTSWYAAIDTCNNLTFAGHTDWRLPNIRELQSILDYGEDSPTIDPTYFPNTQSSWYWSSTTYLNSTSSAWYVYFGYGSVSFGDKTSSYYVRAVRGGQ